MTAEHILVAVALWAATVFVVVGLVASLMLISRGVFRK